MLFRSRGRLKYYFQLECQFVIQEDSWLTEILDYGTYYLRPQSQKTMKERMKDGDFSIDPDEQERVPFKDSEENRIQGLLNGKGGKVEGFAENQTFNQYLGYEIGNHGELFNELTIRRKRRR